MNVYCVFGEYMIPKNKKETIEDRITVIADEALNAFLPTVIYRQGKDGVAAAFEIARMFPVCAGIYELFQTSDVKPLLAGILCYAIITPACYIRNKFKRK